MKEKLKNILIKYSISTGIGALLVWFFLWLRDFTGKEPRAVRYLLLCDAFTIPGVMMILTAALIALSNEGALLSIGYMLGYAFRMLIPGLGGSKHERYADYIERKMGKRVKGYGFIFVTGAAFFAIAMVYLALFYKYFKG